jgi:flavoprotein
MTEVHGNEPKPDENAIQAWLRWLAQERVGCNLCHRILFESQVHGGKVTILEVRGVELTREAQIAHLARCVPERQKRNRTPTIMSIL